MARLRVSTTLPAPPDQVWADLADVSSHAEWMRDAVAIRFVTATHDGVGTQFDCDTKVGPLRLTDRMEITRWDPGRAMGVRHTGIVTGEGTFTLARSPRRPHPVQVERAAPLPVVDGRSRRRLAVGAGAHRGVARLAAEPGGPLRALIRLG